MDRVKILKAHIGGLAVIDKLVLSVAMACVILGFWLLVYAVTYLVLSYPVAGLGFVALAGFCYYLIQVFEL